MTPAARHLGMAAAVVLGLAGAGAALLSPPWLVALREAVFDLAMPAPPPTPEGPPVHVVELPRNGPGGAPWSRRDLAALIAALDAAGPAAIGVDLLLAGTCDSPETTELAAALSATSAPVILGFLLAADGATDPGPPAPLAVMAQAPAWDAPAAEAPCPTLVERARLALSALPGDGGGRVRAFPAAGFVAGRAYPSLAVTLAGLGRHLAAPVLGRAEGARAEGWLRFDTQTIPVGAGGLIRFAPTPPAGRIARRHSAAAVMAGDTPPPGAIVLIGSALPEAGGLRASRATPLHPSVDLHADAVEQLLSASLPRRPALARWTEALAALAGALVAAFAARRMAPAQAMAVAGALALLPAAGTALAAGRGLLFDPVPAVLATLLAAATALLAEAMASRRRAERLGRRMRRHLPDAAIDRLDRAGTTLAPERREITALFTDIEGFTAMTRRLPPEEVVRLLDAYMTGVTDIVERHGGMVDKIVGDAVHAFFNAPRDLPDHVDYAIACAEEIQGFSTFLRSRPDMLAAGFGPTRIGVETGPVLLGDVGQGGRVDYTAHGDAVNMAARLQEANKEHGTLVMIGPAASARATRPLLPGPLVDLRSFGPVRVCLLPPAA